MSMLDFILLYVLFPVIGIIVGVVMFLVAKKAGLIKKSKTIVYLIAACVLLAIPALFGFIDYHFMPYFYIGLLIIYLLLGLLHLKLSKEYIGDWSSKPYYVEFLCVLVMTIIGAAFFSLIFNLCNELQYGWWACTGLLPFIFPSLYRKTYQSYLAIPLEVYTSWSYDKEEREMVSEYMDSNKIIVVELELFKQVEDIEPLNIKAKASDNMPFGVWFKLFIDDYNKKSPSSPISYTGDEDSYGWIFYVVTAILGRKKYIDPELTFGKNKIKEQNVIIAKRTMYQEKTEME